MHERLTIDVYVAKRIIFDKWDQHAVVDAMVTSHS